MYDSPEENKSSPTTNTGPINGIIPKIKSKSSSRFNMTRVRQQTCNRVAPQRQVSSPKTSVSLGVTKTRKEVIKSQEVSEEASSSTESPLEEPLKEPLETRIASEKTQSSSDPNTLLRRRKSEGGFPSICSTSPLETTVINNSSKDENKKTTSTSTLLPLNNRRQNDDGHVLGHNKPASPSSFASFMTRSGKKYPCESSHVSNESCFASSSQDWEDEIHPQSKNSHFETASRFTRLSSQETVITKTSRGQESSSHWFETREEGDHLIVRVDDKSPQEPDILTIEATSPSPKRRLRQRDDDSEDSDGHPIQDVSVDLSRIHSLDDEEGHQETTTKEIQRSSGMKRTSRHESSLRKDHLVAAAAFQGITSRHNRRYTREDGQEILLSSSCLESCLEKSSQENISKESRLQRFATKIRVSMF